MFGSKLDSAVIKKQLEKIEKYASKKNFDGVIRFLDEPDRNVQKATLAGLAKCGGDSSFNVLIRYLQHPDADFREAAANALIELNNVHSRAYIYDAYKHEEDESAKAALYKALTIIKEY